MKLLTVEHVYATCSYAASWRVCQLADGQHIVSRHARVGDGILAAALGTVQDELAGQYRVYGDHESAWSAMLRLHRDDALADLGLLESEKSPEYGLEANT